MHTGVTSSLPMRQRKSSMKKIMRLILDEVTMSDGHMYSVSLLFFNTEKFWLN